MPRSAIALVLFAWLQGGSRAFLDDNPALYAYQDDGKCFPFTESWYIVYRNYEDDPYFGGTAKCAKATEVGPYVYNTTIVLLEYGNKKQYSKVSLTSAPSYDAQNVADLQILNPKKHRKPFPEPPPFGHFPASPWKWYEGSTRWRRSNAAFNITATYIDCSNCKVFRNLYADGGNGCTLWKPESKVTRNDACCDFVFDLLCGGSPKYQVYDNCS